MSSVRNSISTMMSKTTSLKMRFLFTWIKVKKSYSDYSESYENKQQWEIQSAYFGHTGCSRFSECCYLHDAENEIICESVTIASDLSDHSKAAAITSVLMVINHLREKQDLPLKINPTVWRDGCSVQL